MRLVPRCTSTFSRVAQPPAKHLEARHDPIGSKNVGVEVAVVCCESMQGGGWALTGLRLHLPAPTETLVFNPLIR